MVIACLSENCVTCRDETHSKMKAAFPEALPLKSGSSLSLRSHDSPDCPNTYTEFCGRKQSGAGWLVEATSTTRTLACWSLICIPQNNPAFCAKFKLFPQKLSAAPFEAPSDCATSICCHGAWAEAQSSWCTYQCKDFIMESHISSHGSGFKDFSLDSRLLCFSSV